jgi:excisionase family DNA binding protein
LELHSVTNLSKEICISRATIINWINSKKIKAIRFGNVYRIPDDEVERIKSSGVTDQIEYNLVRTHSKNSRAVSSKGGRRPWER